MGPWQRNAFMKRMFVLIFSCRPYVIVVERKEGEKVEHEKKSQINPFGAHVEKQ